MVQEVQTWVWIYNESTLETIEAIGTSSFKIVEWRQTKWWHYTSNVEAKGTVTWIYHDGDSRTSGLVQSSNMTINSQNGRTPYIISEKWLRISIAWTYHITLSRNGWASSQKPTIYVKVWGETLYTKYSNGYINETVEWDSDFGKFDKIEIWGEFEYTGGSTTAQCQIDYILTIQQL